MSIVCLPLSVQAKPTQTERFNRLPAIPEAIEENTSKEPFYVLTDKSYGTNEHALIRLEVPGSYARYREPLEADIRLYKINQPLTFLSKQPDLHRVQVAGRYRGASAIPVADYLWDSWVKASRLSWQRIFSAQLRQTVTSNHPELKMPVSTLYQATPVRQQVHFDPISEFPLVTQFRYPLWQSKPIAPPEDVKLAGSSSNNLQPKLGNTMISIGQLPAGLYLIEAMIAEHRATTLLFVSDTVAITKASADQMFIWTVNRQTGQPNPNAHLMWTDGVGTIERAETGEQGIAQLKRTPPEHSYLMGEDAQGGVFVSENYYYDSEIYNTKLYTITDRPLYRAGETVYIKTFARTFLNAQQSGALETVPVTYEITDPSGQLLIKETLKGKTGQDLAGQFSLPDKALPGGYEIRLQRGDDLYTAAFRVANYIKPHFDILLDTPQDLKTGKAIEAKVILRYPNGEAVKNASVNVNVRAQQLSMVDGQLEYAGQFPVKLSEENYTSGKEGSVVIKLPAADQPSRYVVTILAADAAAYRVKMTREILIERGVNPYTLTSDHLFGQQGKSVRFTFRPQAQGGEKPAKYELLRLEDQQRSTHAMTSEHSFDATFAQPGSYTVMLKDKLDNLLGATNYWVQGEGMKAAPDSVEIVFDKTNYRVGETAKALVTFPVKVNNALLTMERDNVEQYGLLSTRADWFSSQRLSDRQYMVSIPVTDRHAPNMTFSVLYQQQGSYFFENAGLVVAQPQITLDIRPDKSLYKPGEMVTLSLNSVFNGKGVPAQLAVSVVDEMVYVLQPEISPGIVDFFYHPRRNNVMTQSSLNFIGYDKSVSSLKGANDQQQGQVHERAIKVLERPRRDEKDTAYWHPSIQTDAEGKTTIRFKMPDSLTRWRITVRAMNDQGVVGQRTAYIQSQQPYYLKWTGPRQMRPNDSMQAEVMAFNQTQQETSVIWEVKQQQKVLLTEKRTLSPGANYLSVPLSHVAGNISISLLQDGKVLDSLVTTLQQVPANWVQPQQQIMPLQGVETPLKLPSDASQLRMTILPREQAGLSQMIDSLISYPYGCVEQTSSRLIPLGISYSLLPENTAQPVRESLRYRLLSQRLRLIDMAGAGAKFTWWGNASQQQDLFLTSYAYFADYHAARALGLPLSSDDVAPLLSMYQEQSAELPLLQRMLTLWLMKQMGLPVKTLLTGADEQLAGTLSGKSPASISLTAQDSLVFAAPNSRAGLDMALLVSARLHQELGTPVPDTLLETYQQAQPRLEANNNIAVQSLRYLQGSRERDFSTILTGAGVGSPTIERALSLVWLQQAGINATLSSPAMDIKPVSDWRRLNKGAMGAQWWVTSTLPRSLLLTEPPPAGQVAVLQFNTQLPSKGSLPIEIVRTLYRLVPVSSPKADAEDGLSYKVEKMPAGEALQSNQLYVDEITLSSAGRPLEYALVEAALPPGGGIEATTWGMQIAGLDTPDAKPFGNNTFEEGTLSYRLPLARLSEPVKLRQLVRFSQRGTFTLPPVRVFSMYQPSLNSMQKGNLTLTVK